MSERDAAAGVAQALFEEMPGFRITRMFGGLGLFAADVMFGLLDDGLIYLKTDAALEADLRAAGAHAWLYTERKGPMAGIPQETSYLSLPEAAYDDPEEARAWAERAQAVAQTVREARGPRRRKGTG